MVKGFVSFNLLAEQLPLQFLLLLNLGLCSSQISLQIDQVIFLAQLLGTLLESCLLSEQVLNGLIRVMHFVFDHILMLLAFE